MEATRSLDDSNFGAISRGSGAFAADRLSSTHTGHTSEPAMPLPVGSKRCFCRGFVSGSIHRRPATFTPCWTPPVNSTLSPHILGSLELVAGPYRHHVHQWLRRTVQSTWGALAPIFAAKVPSSHSPQGCLAWAWPAHPFDSLSALEMGQGDQKCMCVHHTSCCSAMQCVNAIAERGNASVVLPLMSALPVTFAVATL